MMKTLLRPLVGATCLATMLALAASTAQAQNVLVDPGFESGAPGQPNPIPIPSGVGGGWAVFNGATIATNYPQTGSFSLQGIQGAGQAWNFMAAYQVLPAAPGIQYELSADYATTTGLGSYAGAFIQLTYFDAGGNDIGTVETGGSGANALNFNPAAVDTWYNASIIATAPAGAAYVAPFLAFMMDGSQGSEVDLYWDDGSLTVVPEPTSLALFGLGCLGALLWRRR